MFGSNVQARQWGAQSMAMQDYNELATDYAQYRDALPAVTEILVEGGAITRDSRVLELGCGTGNYVVSIRDAVGCRCWGLDRSEAMLGHARARASDIDFTLGEATCLDFADEGFDLVYSVDVVHHVDDPAALYRETYRVLAPGGRLCTITHSEELFRDTMVLSRYFPETVPVNLARYPTVAQLRSWMTGAGFRDVSEAVVSQPAEVTDSGLYANKAYSTLHLIPQQAFERGLAKLERDLETGPITGLRRYLTLWATK